jgi:peptidoglycan hydrolase-like protein with peptidoglycan-binding domain
MYESYRQIMKMSGMLDPEQEAQMQEAAQQMAELEKQMASMPASQRQMMEKMMGPQLEMMRNMSSGGGFQVEMVTDSITVNPPIAGADGQPCPSGSAQSSGAEVSVMPREEIRLTKMVQVSLVSLGYDTGTTDGTMNKKTAIAISQFQAANSMEVTGQPSPQLAGVLQSAQAGSINDELTADYLEGHWCTERTQERELYKFAADGSYRLGVNGITITQMDGINFFKDTYSRQSFFDKFEGVATKEENRFSMRIKGGSQETFLRGNCFE